jgi:hypothetical protein
VEPDDRLAAPLVWQGMADGRVPVYPEGTAYYYQVFHGGISYGRRRNREDAVRLAAEDRESFLGLTRPPGFADAVSFWRTLLAA